MQSSRWLSLSIYSHVVLCGGFRPADKNFLPAAGRGSAREELLQDEEQKPLSNARCGSHRGQHKPLLRGTQFAIWAWIFQVEGKAAFCRTKRKVLGASKSIQAPLLRSGPSAPLSHMAVIYFPGSKVFLRAPAHLPFWQIA